MKQCVVVIHGVGEQKPMGTIRKFVDHVLGRFKDGKRAYWSRPDSMSELFELRRLKSKKRASTDFYEYYWAYKVEGTKLLDSILWILALASRSRRNIPDSSFSLWIACRLVLVGIVSLAVIGGLGGFRGWFTDRPVMVTAWVIGAAIFAIAQYGLIHFIGDAARYLSPRPKNIKLRRSIRSDGIQLVRKLIDSKEYDRITIVGHSLGSVIAYDVLTHLWHDYHEQVPALHGTEWTPTILRSLEGQGSIQPIMRDQIAKHGEVAGESPEALNRFQRMQHEALIELRSFGNPWCVSDLITLGSPLTHAMLLLAESRDDLESRKEERVLPTCPPQPDAKGYSFSAPFNVDLKDSNGRTKKFTPRIYHDAALFAVTRWINLFIPARMGLFGDIVGGPLASTLGRGIRDVPVTTHRGYGLAKLTIAAHTSYWHKEATDSPLSTLHPPVALRALIDALDLSSLRKYRLPSPTQASNPSHAPEQDIHQAEESTE